MPSPLLTIDANHPEPELLAQAADFLRRGGVIAAPTDTVYGLLADPADPVAVRRIYEIKGRDFRRPLILLVSSIAMAEQYCSRLPDLARSAMQHFWPGALTIILERSAAVPDHLLAGGNTIGLRMPNHAVPLGLMDTLGFPLASTSANRSTQPAATCASQIAVAFPAELDLIIDSGVAPLARESSVVDFTPTLAGDPPRLLREGAVARGRFARLLGPIAPEKPGDS